MISREQKEIFRSIENNGRQQEEKVAKTTS